MLQVMLGFQPDAPAGVLTLDPHLPDWLPDITVRDLCLGAQAFDLRFVRDGRATRVEVLRGDPANVRIAPMPPWPMPLWGVAAA